MHLQNGRGIIKNLWVTSKLNKLWDGLRMGAEKNDLIANTQKNPGYLYLGKEGLDRKRSGLSHLHAWLGSAKSLGRSLCVACQMKSTEFMVSRNNLDTFKYLSVTYIIYFKILINTKSAFSVHNPFPRWSEALLQTDIETKMSCLE